MSVDLKTIIEGLLFVAEAPLTVTQLAEILETEDRQSIKDALIALATELDELDRAFTLVEVAGGWRFRTKSNLAFWLRKFKKQAITRLSPAALETLSIVAYKQPVLKSTIENLRGVNDAGGVLRMLMEKDLVRVMGREDLPGKPLIYGTTKRFLEVFDLSSIKDLPTLDEIDGLLQDAANIGPIETSAQRSFNLGAQDKEVSQMEEPDEDAMADSDQEDETGGRDPELDAQVADSEWDDYPSGDPYSAIHGEPSAIPSGPEPGAEDDDPPSAA